MLSVPKNQIISVFLGVILLASVASFSPTPVSGYVTCSTGLIETRDDYKNYDRDIYPLESSSGNYNFVMPIVSSGSDEDKSGTVKFSYQVQAGGSSRGGATDGAIIVPEKDIGTREIVKDPEWGKYGLGSTQPFCLWN